MRLSGLSLIILLALAGCAGPRPSIETELPADFPFHRVEQIQQNIILTSDTLHAFRGRASFSVSAPEQGGRFTAEIKSQRGDSLYMSISPGLGIEAARALVTQDSVFLYDRIKNTLSYGSLKDASTILSIPVSAEDLFRNLLGILVPDPEVEWSLEADSAFYYLDNPTQTLRYVIDPSLWRVVRYVEYAASGDLVEERIFSDFDVFDGVYLPRRVIFRRPGNHTVASLYYRNLDLNPDQLSFELNVRTSTKRVLLD